MSFEIKVLIKERPDGKIEVLAVTLFGEVPLILFPSREEFAKFAFTVEDFHYKFEPRMKEVPDVFKRAFSNES